MAMSILISGSSGFVGEHIVRALRDKFQIIEINRRPPSADGRHVTWNFRDHLPTSLPDSIDMVIHCAATDGRDSIQADSDCYDVNVLATERLLDYASEAQAAKFLYLSTGSVYGLSASPHVESGAISPAGAYACSKVTAEVLLSRYQSRMQTLCLRLFYPYGPGQRLPRLIPGILAKLAAGNPIPLNCPEGYPNINPLYIADLVNLIERLIDSDATGTYNLAGAEVVSIRELASRLALLTGTRATFEYQGESRGHLIGDIEKICKVTGICPTWQLDEGLAEIVRALRHSSSS